MPLGEGYGQLIRPTGTTPLQSGVRTFDPGIGEALTGLGQEIGRRVKPALMDEAATKGRLEGDAGIQSDVIPITDIDLAYKRANEQAYLARNDIDRDETLAALEQQFGADPEKFQLAALEAKSAQIKGARGSLAVAVEQSWDRAITRRTTGLAKAKVQRDLKKSLDDIDVGIARNRAVLEAAARNGTLGSDEAQEAMQKLQEGIKGKVENPLSTYTAVEADRDLRVVSGQLASLTVGRTVATTFADAMTGGDTIAGAEAKARAGLLEAFSTNPALAGLDQAERARLLKVADDALVENASQARRLKADADAEERAATAALREKHQTNYYTLLPAADAGGLTIAEINKREAAGDISAPQADALRGNTRAAASRAETARNQAIAAARRAKADAEREARLSAKEAGRGLVYRLIDDADLDPDGALAEATRARGAGIITEAQLRSIERAARAELNSDDKERVAQTRDVMKRLGAKSEDVSMMARQYRLALDQNPDWGEEERDRFHETFQKRYVAQTGRKSSPTGQVRSVPQIQADIMATTRSNAPANVKAQKLDRLRNELKAATARN